ALSHPGVVTIHSIDDCHGLDFIVMEFVEGETLRAAVARGALELPRLLEVGAQVAEALAAAHALNLIHRDIKSENIMLTATGRAKVLDFGLAKSVQAVAVVAGEVDAEAPTRVPLTGAGVVIGTVPYMSPEQTRGEPLDARTDIFSLGCVLYEAATGRLPFTGPSALAVAHAIAAVDPPPPSRLRPELPREFDLVVERALAKERTQRYTSASELAGALRALKGIATPETFAGFNTTADMPAASDTAESVSFVGREPEVGKLDELLRRAVEGSGRVVFVTGEPGMGKSALVDEFLRRARRKHTGLLIARGRCAEQYGTGEAYLPFLDAVGALLSGPGRGRVASLLRTYAPTWCLQFPAAVASTAAFETLQQETAGASKERMLREMGDALAALAAQVPVILLLD
ncbi:MAG: serine/threonine-protein kinase, partial [Pyrinomonadaceae bacterium]